MVMVERNDLLRNRRVEAPRPAGRATGERFQRRVATCGKARLPILEGRATDMGCATGQVDITGGLPGFKQQAALRGRGHREVNAFLSHEVLRVAWADLGVV
jgi:hypothetical protein